MHPCVHMTTWSIFKPVILAYFLTGGNIGWVFPGRGSSEPTRRARLTHYPLALVRGCASWNPGTRQCRGSLILRSGGGSRIAREEGLDEEEGRLCCKISKPYGPNSLPRVWREPAYRKEAEWVVADIEHRASRSRLPRTGCRAGAADASTPRTVNSSM